MLRPFERDIVGEIRASPKRVGGGGRSIPRKGVWIRGHLQDVGRDYPYSMYRIWKRFLEGAGLNIKAGTYQQFRTYICLETVRADPQGRISLKKRVLQKLLCSEP